MTTDKEIEAEILFNLSNEIKNNNEKLVMALIKNDFDLNYYKHRMIYACVNHNKINIFELLLEDCLSIEIVTKFGNNEIKE